VPEPTDTSLDYVQRVNRAIDYIVSRLDEPLPLETVAKVAHFSPFHFHRVFKSLMGETLNDFTKRVRLERALQMLSHHPGRSLTEIALACGFGSSSDFSRSFKQRYGVPPSAIDLPSFRDERRKELERLGADAGAPHLLTRLPRGENPDGFAATLRTLPPRRVAYLRVLDPYRPDVVVNAAGRLMEWAERAGVADNQWLGYMWEDPEIVPLKDCRYDVAVVADDFEPGGEVGAYDFPAMQVAEIEIRGGIDLEMRAIDWIFGTWLPSSGYVPDNQPAFEAWIGRPFAHGLEHFELRVQVPVVRNGRG